METSYKIYDFRHLRAFIEALYKLGGEWVGKWEKKRVYHYLNIPASFDIETTSTTTQNGDKLAYMYVWQLGVNGVVIFGRTWEEYKKTLQALTDLYELGTYRKLIIYVHNLEFEMQFMRKYIKIDSLFASETRRPIYFNSGCFEYRCSYILTGMSLTEVAKSLTTHKCAKMVGDLDYDLIHNPTTHLTKKEVKYAVNDVRVVMFYIDEQIKIERKVCNIPLTKTGYVRRAIRNKVKKNKHDYALIQNCKMTLDFYTICKRAYMGGFTHANIYLVGLTIDNAASFDYTSSYPAVMLSELYPCTSPTLRTLKSIDEFYHYIKYYNCIFEIKLKNVKLKKGRYDAPLPEAKCYFDSKVHKIVDNGRLREIDECITYINEVDFEIYKAFYDFSFEIGTFYTMRKGYLTKSYVEEILDYYEKKTTLKNVTGREKEYMLAKGNINSIYGMACTDILRDSIEYSNEWTCTTPDNPEEIIEKYNNNFNRASYYPIGLYVSSYARKNLMSGIIAFGKDYIYSDTDSLKVTNYINHLDYINAYNEQIKEKINKCLEHYGIDIRRARPCTIKGEEKPLGVWDFEGVYKHFKTLGAKRYMVEEQDGDIKITVAGVNKKTGSAYMKSLKNPFDAFNFDLEFNEGVCGKLTHTYIDDERESLVTDYRGNTELINARSGVHLSKSSYKIGLTGTTEAYLRLQKALKLGDNPEVMKL